VTRDPRQHPRHARIELAREHGLVIAHGQVQQLDAVRAQVLLVVALVRPHVDHVSHA